MHFWCAWGSCQYDTSLGILKQNLISLYHIKLLVINVVAKTIIITSKNYMHTNALASSCSYIYCYTMAISMTPYILKSFDLPLLATFSESSCASSQCSLEYSSVHLKLLVLCSFKAKLQTFSG